MIETTDLNRRIAARRRREAIGGYLLVAAPTVLVFGLFFYPAVLSFIRTITNGAGLSAPISFARYRSFFSSPIARSNLLFTFYVTLVSIAILFVICFPLALYLRFSKSRIANWLLSIAMLPLFVPGIMTSYALIRFLRPRGMLVTLLNLVGLLERDDWRVGAYSDSPGPRPSAAQQTPADESEIEAHLTRFEPVP